MHDFNDQNIPRASRRRLQPPERLSQEQDKEYNRILLRLKDMHVVLLHFDRGGSKSYWGGKYKDGEIMGENKLGKIMMDLW